MTISVGDKIPAVDLNVMTDDGPGSISTDEIFSGKTVAVFGLPGAFTRTCSARHLPGFVDNADALKAKGIDTIVCIAVNDAFVMGAWGKAQDVGDRVMMVADGSAKFTQATGLEADMSAAVSGFPWWSRTARSKALTSTRPARSRTPAPRSWWARFKARWTWR